MPTLQEARELAATLALPVGAHISVPLRLSDGSVYRTFCCFSHEVDESLNERDLGVVRMFADVATQYVEADAVRRRRERLVEERITSALTTEGALTTVIQPVIGLEDGVLVGLEALSRFSLEPRRTPDVWFAEAASIGLGLELERLAIRSPLSGATNLPEPAFIAVNVSPDAVVSGVLDDVLADIGDRAAVPRFALCTAVGLTEQNKNLVVTVTAGAVRLSARHGKVQRDGYPASGGGDRAPHERLVVLQPAGQ